jgi:type II secretory pathway pseudopilin PulG
LYFEGSERLMRIGMVRSDRFVGYFYSLRYCLVLGVLGALILPKMTFGQQSTQSDSAAIQALQNVIAQSGGQAAWGGLTSAQESFSVAGPTGQAAKMTLLLDDWSLATTRYRRKTQGQKDAPIDHNGTPTFSVSMGGTLRTAPEFDQPRVLMGHLPAAAAEILLQRPEYVLKISTSQACAVGSVCVEVYRVSNPKLPPVPEELWTITSATGLPSKVSYRAVVFSPLHDTWSQASFLKYAQEGNLVVPTSIETSFLGRQQMLTFVSLEQNPGFDPAKFDNEVGQ